VVAAVVQELLVVLAAAVHLAAAVTAEQVHLLIHLGAVQHQPVKLSVALITTQVEVVEVLGERQQRAAVMAVVLVVLTTVELLVRRTRAVVVQAAEQQQEMLLEAQEVLDLSLSDI
jgi:hypothetical protein